MRSLLCLFLVGICYATFVRATEDVVWKANGYRDATLEESDQGDRPMTHAVDECGAMVAWARYPFLCSPGKFVSSPATRAMYQCDFQKYRGRLFYYTATNNGYLCSNDFTKQTFTGVFNFTLPGLVTQGGGLSFGSSFYAWRNRIYQRSTDCLVMGFACIIDNAVHSNDL